MAKRVGVIPKTSSVNRLIENYESWTVELTVDDMKKIKEIKKPKGSRPSAKTEEEIIKLNHYTNFQPLWAVDNLRKSNKVFSNKSTSL